MSLACSANSAVHRIVEADQPNRLKVAACGGDDGKGVDRAQSRRLLTLLNAEIDPDDTLELDLLAASWNLASDQQLLAGPDERLVLATRKKRRRKLDSCRRESLTGRMHVTSLTSVVLPADGRINFSRLSELDAHASDDSRRAQALGRSRCESPREGRRPSHTDSTRHSPPASPKPD